MLTNSVLMYFSKFHYNNDFNGKTNSKSVDSTSIVYILYRCIKAHDERCTYISL